LAQLPPVSAALNAGYQEDQPYKRLATNLRRDTEQQNDAPSIKKS
jgi:hypothetical protein